MRILISLGALAAILGISFLARANDLPACVNDDCDCSDFTTWQEAQTVLNAFVGDPFLLDRDKDGTACEKLPGVPTASLATSESESSTPAPTSPTSLPATSNAEPISAPPAASEPATSAPAPIPALW